MAKIPFHFDEARICIGDFCIARNTGLVAFVYLLKAVEIPCVKQDDETVCVNNASLFHNLYGKCFFRFTESKSGGLVFSRVKFVIDPDLYPGLRDMSRTKRMESLKDFVAVSLNDRLNASSPPGEDGFSRVGENLYESKRVRIKLELDRYHVVITASYRERAEGDQTVSPAGMTDLLNRVEELENRLDKVEGENKELRKVNDMILDLFGGMKSAHDVTKISMPEDTDKSETKPAEKSAGMNTGPFPSPEKMSALLKRYN